MFCIDDYSTAKMLTVLLAGVLGGLIVFTVWLFLRIRPKIKRVVEPNEQEPWNTTYCWFYPANLGILAISLVVVLVKQLSGLLQLVMGDHWYLFMFPERFQAIDSPPIGEN